MERVTVDDLDVFEHPVPTAPGGRPVGEALGVEGFAMKHYDLQPGETLSGGMHTHEDQEEVFYVLDGTVTFETPDDEFDLEAGEAVRFAPGEYQYGRNDTDDRATALALGAPPDSEEIRSLLPCPECGERAELAVDIPDSRDAVDLSCPECGAESRMSG